MTEVWRPAGYSKHWRDGERWPAGFEEREGQLFHEGAAVCDVFRVVGLRFDMDNTYDSALVIAIGDKEALIPARLLMEKKWSDRDAFDIACILQESGLRIEYDRRAPGSIRACLMAFVRLGMWHIE